MTTKIVAFKTRVMTKTVAAALALKTCSIYKIGQAVIGMNFPYPSLVIPSVLRKVESIKKSAQRAVDGLFDQMLINVFFLIEPYIEG